MGRRSCRRMEIVMMNFSFQTEAFPQLYGHLTSLHLNLRCQRLVSKPLVLSGASSHLPEIFLLVSSNDKITTDCSQYPHKLVAEGTPLSHAPKLQVPTKTTVRYTRTRPYKNRALLSTRLQRKSIICLGLGNNRIRNPSRFVQEQE